MDGRKPEDSASFADLVHASSVHDGEHVAGAWPQPIREGQWVDDRGAHWHIRGRDIEPTGPALRRLLKRTDLRVLHAYSAQPREVDGREREALLERVRRFAAGDAPPYSAFRLAEFRSEDQQVMLVIEEAC
jgi:hypothetical protein